MLPLSICSRHMPTSCPIPPCERAAILHSSPSGLHATLHPAPCQPAHGPCSLTPSPDCLWCLSACPDVGTLELRTLAPLELRTLAPLELRTLAPLELRTLAPLELRTLAPAGARLLGGTLITEGFGILEEA